MQILNQTDDYVPASKAYWGELYQAVKQDTENYNLGKLPYEHLSVGDPNGGSLNENIFEVRHNQKALAPTQVTRFCEKPQHKIQILCNLPPGAYHELGLRMNSAGQVEAYDGNGSKLTVSEVLAIIVNPLKRLGFVPPREADALMPARPDGEPEDDHR
jgi:hypothetical protein